MGPFRSLNDYRLGVSESPFLDTDPDIMLVNVGHISHIDIPLSSNSYPIKNGKTGELGQDRLEVRWEAVMFLFNVVNLNV
jgi:hypothetical protein